jgi:dynactin-5
MEPPMIHYQQRDFLETHTGNKVSRKSIVRGSKHIHLIGKCIISHGVVIRGDLAPIKIGKYTIIREDVVLRPTYILAKGQFKYKTLHIGDHVYIGEGSIVCASKIGSNVYIGKNCVISHRCVLRDNCRIEDNSILTPDIEVAGFCMFEGSPAKMTAELPESFPFIMSELTQGYYSRFKAS